MIEKKLYLKYILVTISYNYVYRLHFEIRSSSWKKSLALPTVNIMFIIQICGTSEHKVCF